MGVYIKGMEMPTNCKRCRLKMNCDECEGWQCFCLPLRMEIGYFDDLLADKRRDDCPLVPIPPHGRLIDADALISRIYDAAKQQPEIADLYEDEADDMIAWLKTTPTIIEAEGGDGCKK